MTASRRWASRSHRAIASGRVALAFTTIAAVVALVGVVAPAPDASADQWAVLERNVGDRALAAISPGSRIALYCSLCDDATVEVVRVLDRRLEPWTAHSRAAATAAGAAVTPEVTLAIEALPLVRSTARFAEGAYDAASAGFTATPDALPRVYEVDLAYVYVEVAPGRFACAALRLGLPAVVRVPVLEIPMAATEGHAQPHAPCEPLATPSPERPAASF